MEMKMAKKRVGWTREQDKMLVSLYNEGRPFEDIITTLNSMFITKRNVPQCSSRLGRIRDWMKKHYVALRKKGDRMEIPLKSLKELHKQDEDNPHKGSKKPKKNFQEWTKEQQDSLVTLYNAGQPFKTISKHLNRQFPEAKRTINQCRFYLRNIRQKVEKKADKPQYNDRKRRPILIKTKKVLVEKTPMAEKMIRVMGSRTMSPKEVEEKLIQSGEIEQKPNKLTRAYISQVFASAKNEGNKLFRRVKRGRFRVAKVQPLTKVPPEILKLVNPQLLMNPAIDALAEQVLIDPELSGSEPITPTSENKPSFRVSYNLDETSHVTILLDGVFNCKEFQNEAKKLISAIAAYGCIQQ
jgi:hypothetical protein